MNPSDPRLTCLAEAGSALLAPQLTAGGLMVPEMIAVDAVLTDLSRELGGNGFVPEPWSGRIPLGRILEVDRERACIWAVTGVRSHLPPARIALPSLVSAML